jgi:N utilization substance protein B
VRRKARERALQFLFGLDFTGYAWDEVVEDFWAVHLTRPSVRRYAERVIRGVCEQRHELDREIADALRNWSPERVGRVERNVLRIALFEMRCIPDVPATVAINEALEVTKRFGADDAPRFVNGVLDRLRKARNDAVSTGEDEA